MNIRDWLVSLGAGVLLLATCSTSAQLHGAAAPYVPSPDPGYGLYYHDAAGAPNAATRWGYHDGWEDGRHDRNHGETNDAKERPNYVTPPAHGGHPGMTRDQYEKIYRGAYVHGYEHGSRL